MKKDATEPDAWLTYVVRANPRSFARLTGPLHGLATGLAGMPGTGIAVTFYREGPDPHISIRALGRYRNLERILRDLKRAGAIHSWRTYPYCEKPWVRAAYAIGTSMAITFTHENERFDRMGYEAPSDHKSEFFLHCLHGFMNAMTLGRTEQEVGGLLDLGFRQKRALEAWRAKRGK